MVELPERTLAELAEELRGTRFELGSVGTFGNAVCLFPTDDGPLLAWRERALLAIGVPDRLDDDWRLHLTVSRCESTPAEDDAIMRTLHRSLPVACRVGDLLIVELDEAGGVCLRRI